MVPLTPQGYPEDWDNVMWDGKLAVQWSYARFGWVGLSLLGAGASTVAVLRLSEVFDPFNELVRWLEAIADDALPATLTINEESCCKRLEVRRYAGRQAAYSDIEFRVTDLDWDAMELPDPECRLLLRTTRVQLLDEFTRRLSAWLQHDYEPDGWWRINEDDYDDPATLAEDRKRADLRQRLDLTGLLQRMQAGGV